MIKADWYLFTSNEVWKQATNPNLFYSAETVTENLYRTIKCGANFSISIMEINQYSGWVGNLPGAD